MSSLDAIDVPPHDVPRGVERHALLPLRLPVYLWVGVCMAVAAKKLQVAESQRHVWVADVLWGQVQLVVHYLPWLDDPLPQAPFAEAVPRFEVCLTGRLP